MIKIQKLDYHRNGVAGLGFHVAIARDTVEKRDMLIVRFPKSSDRDAGGILCAAFDIKLLADHNITFGENSWRGDHYSDDIDKAIATNGGE